MTSLIGISQTQTLHLTIVPIPRDRGTIGGGCGQYANLGNPKLAPILYVHHVPSLPSGCSMVASCEYRTRHEGLLPFTLPTATVTIATRTLFEVTVLMCTWVKTIGVYRVLRNNAVKTSVTALLVRDGEPLRCRQTLTARKLTNVGSLYFGYVPLRQPRLFQMTD